MWCSWTKACLYVEAPEIAWKSVAMTTRYSNFISLLTDLIDISSGYKTKRTKKSTRVSTHLPMGPLVILVVLSNSPVKKEDFKKKLPPKIKEFKLSTN